jgi:hypothetical protein
MPGTIPKREFKAQLDRILRSRRFMRAERQAELLSYLGQHSLQGHIPTEGEIAAEVFGRPEWHNEDRIVAINRSRLKETLASYYENEGANQNVIVKVHGRRVIAEYRQAPPAVTAESLAAPILRAGNEFFAPAEGTAPRCVVTGETEGVAWYPIDGDRYNFSLGNLVPLSQRLRSILDGVWRGRRRTLTEQLNPPKLGNELAPDYFRRMCPASAYGCVALAFSLGSLPCATQSDHLRARWLCDAISYARSHFSEPLMRHVLRQMALPFLTRLDQVDAGTALRVVLQLTGLLEEIGRTQDAQTCLEFGHNVSRAALRTFFEESTRESYGLLRRRAQLLAERNPTDGKFDGMITQAQEHATDIEERGKRTVNTAL